VSSVALTVTVVLVFFLGGIAAGVVAVIAMSARRAGRDFELNEPREDEPEDEPEDHPWWQSRDDNARRLKIVSRPS
jgi:MFS superfamily sulfate permease-like transporter